ncbi:hypothetical protein C7S16_5292 [Burkholderia thailandensis]|uniref:Uncharacterized protein n=1 Tax=Burkholderia thailandensis TaxID=57975 RepID=A0AAW9CX41_BURTH|nr:hypothetical protein [Burkholderia thailandensis]
MRAPDSRRRNRSGAYRRASWLLCRMGRIRIGLNEGANPAGDERNAGPFDGA